MIEGARHLTHFVIGSDNVYATDIRPTKTTSGSPLLADKGDQELSLEPV